MHWSLWVKVGFLSQNRLIWNSKIKQEQFKSNGVENKVLWTCGSTSVEKYGIDRVN